jgi:hypothetical protein
MEAAAEEMGQPVAADSSAKPKKPTNSYFSTHRLKQKLIAQTYDCLFAVAILLVVTAGCVVSFLYCKSCLFGIIALSFCLCPWVPYLNIPLWIAIIMLLHWGFTTVSQNHKLVLGVE